MDKRHAGGDSVDVGAHECDGFSIFHSRRVYAKRLVENHGNQASTKHCEQTICLVLIDCV